MYLKFIYLQEIEILNWCPCIAVENVVYKL